MRYIRHEMRSHRQPRLSVPQFRALIFASVHDGPSLSAMAEHLGLSLPAASRMADQLVRRGLLERRQAARDRRRVSLSPTARGRAEYRRAHNAARAAIARRFDAISKDERLLVGRAMALLGRVFGVVDMRGAGTKSRLKPANNGGGS
jgi:DNA-binding MarR family transcriptional regulator